MSVARRKAINLLWQRGDIRWKYHAGQEHLANFVDTLSTRQKRRGVIKTTRRFGKTFFNAAYAIQDCLKHSDVIIPFIAPTVKSLKTIVTPIFNVILRDCPPDIRPKYRTQDAIYEFHTGSSIVLAGTDNGNAEKLRGIRAYKALLDEAGFMSDLSYIVNDIVTPALMYGDGFLLASSTPPPSSDHYFVTMLQEAELQETCFTRTVWDNPLLSVKEILEFAEVQHCTIDWDTYHKEVSEEKLYDMEWGRSLIVDRSISFRREFEAEILTDPEKAVVPEFTEDRARGVVCKWPRPPHFVPVTVIDTGFIDYTACVFGYWDFAKAKAVVERDLLVDFRGEGTNAESLAKRVLDTERDLWGRKATHRYGDGDLIVLNELTRHGLSIAPVRKDELEAQVSQVRLDLTSDKLVIDPSAVNVITHMKYATWDKQRRKFERSAGHGHYDALAALIYFLRHLNRTYNPYPADYKVSDPYNQVYPSSWEKDPSVDAIVEIFRR